MVDTTVTVEQEDEDPSDAPDQDSSTGEQADNIAVSAATDSAENKAHAEHAAQDAAGAAESASMGAVAAQEAANQAEDAVSAVAGIAQSVLEAVQSIPDRVAEAVSAVVSQQPSTDDVTDSVPILEETPSTPEPVTPPKKEHWLNRKIGGKR